MTARVLADAAVWHIPADGSHTPLRTHNCADLIELGGRVVLALLDAR